MDGQLFQMGIRETDWAQWMRSAISGDADAYLRFLKALTPILRTICRGHCELLGLRQEDAEDIVQEILLTIHFKRGTWKSSGPIGPWISLVVCNKLADALRRHCPTAHVIAESAAGLTGREPGQRDIGALLNLLNERQRNVVLFVSIGGAAVRETADRLFLSEREVQVALHSSLKKLARSLKRLGQGPAPVMSRFARARAMLRPAWL